MEAERLVEGLIVNEDGEEGKDIEEVGLLRIRLKDSVILKENYILVRSQKVS